MLIRRPSNREVYFGLEERQADGGAVNGIEQFVSSQYHAILCHILELLDLCLPFCDVIWPFLPFWIVSGS